MLKRVFVLVRTKERERVSAIALTPGFKLLKGLGHAILGNFSTDRMVIELTKISK